METEDVAYVMKKTVCMNATSLVQGISYDGRGAKPMFLAEGKLHYGVDLRLYDWSLNGRSVVILCNIVHILFVLLILARCTTLQYEDDLTVMAMHLRDFCISCGICDANHDHSWPLIMAAAFCIFLSSCGIFGAAHDYIWLIAMALIPHILSFVVLFLLIPGVVLTCVALLPLSRGYNALIVTHAMSELYMMLLIMASFAVYAHRHLINCIRTGLDAPTTGIDVDSTVAGSPTLTLKHNVHGERFYQKVVMIVNIIGLILSLRVLYDQWMLVESSAFEHFVVGICIVTTGLVWLFQGIVWLLLINAMLISYLLYECFSGTCDNTTCEHTMGVSLVLVLSIGLLCYLLKFITTALDVCFPSERVWLMLRVMLVPTSDTITRLSLSVGFARLFHESFGKAVTNWHMIDVMSSVVLGTCFVCGLFGLLQSNPLLLSIPKTAFTVVLGLLTSFGLITLYTLACSPYIFFVAGLAGIPTPDKIKYWCYDVVLLSGFLFGPFLVSAYGSIAVHAHQRLIQEICKDNAEQERQRTLRSHFLAHSTDVVLY